MPYRASRHLVSAILLGLVSGLPFASSALAAERPALGDAAPAISLPATDSSVHELAALRGKERAVVVFFRGSW